MKEAAHLNAAPARPRARRHQFSYAFPNRVRNGQRSTELWTKWVRAAPVKPIYTLWGTDLGWATRLYPTAPPSESLHLSLGLNMRVARRSSLAGC